MNVRRSVRRHALVGHQLDDSKDTVVRDHSGTMPAACQAARVLSRAPPALSRLAEEESCDNLLKRVGHLDEVLVARLVRQLLIAVSNGHSRGIVHGDITLGHIMLVQLDGNSSQDMRIADLVSASTRLDRTGTPAYMAPEVANRQAASILKADVWSIGVCALELLTGQCVFLGRSHAETYELIRRHAGFEEIDAVLHGNKGWRGLGGDARDFLKCLLEADPHQRLDLPAALAHPWIRFEAGYAGDKELIQDRSPVTESVHQDRPCDRDERCQRLHTSKVGRASSRSNHGAVSKLRMSVIRARALGA